MDVKTAAREGNVGALKLLRDAKVTERESSDLVLLKFGSIVFWEVGYVSLFRDSRMSYTDI